MTAAIISAPRDVARTARYRHAELTLWAHYGQAPEERFVDVRSPPGRIRVIAVGSGPPVFVAHGTAGGGPVLAALLKELPDRTFLLMDRPGFGLSSPIRYSARTFRQTVADLQRDVLDAYVRLITVDRPGYGSTDPVTDASFSVVAQDLSILVQSLDMTDIALIGWSGGGQFALASVPALVGRLDSLTLICTLAPDDVILWFPDETRPMLPAMRADPVASLPMIVKGFEPLMADPAGLAASDPSPADADARALPGVPDALTVMMREAGRQSGAGIAFDVMAGGREDPLAVDAVDVPTWLWYGAGDEYIGLEHGRWYAEQIAESHLEIVEGAGHLLPILRWREILAAAIGR